MKQNLPFSDHLEAYEAWFDKYPAVFSSEVEALRSMLPQGKSLKGMEIGLGTGRFSEALGIKEGIEPSPRMRSLANERGIDTRNKMAEELPYDNLKLDFVLMNFCVSYFDELHGPFLEAYRVLKNDGALVVGFIDKNSPIGKYYEKHKPDTAFYSQATFYSVDKILFELNRVGFKHVTICQTLFQGLDDIKEFQPCKPGYGEGSFVVLKALKKKMYGQPGIYFF